MHSKPLPDELWRKRNALARGSCIITMADEVINAVVSDSDLVTGSESCNFKGKKGYFVPLEIFNSTRSKLSELTSQPASEENAPEIENLSRQLHEMENAKEIALAAMYEAEDRCTSLGKEKETIKEEYEASLSKFSSGRDEYVKQIGHLHKKLDEQTQVILKIRKERDENASAQFDPDVAVDIARQLADANDEKKVIELEINKLRSENDYLKQDQNGLKAKLKSVEDKYDASQDAYFKLMSMPNATDWFEEDYRPTRRISNGVYNLLGRNGVKVLLAADRLARDQARERLFQLRNALNKSSNKDIQGIKDVCSIAWQWIKTAKPSAFKLILPWLRLVFADLWAGIVRSAGYYHNVLATQVDIAKRTYHKKLEDAKAKYPESAGWFAKLQARFTSAVSSVKAFFKRRRGANNGSKSFFQSVKSSILSIRDSIFGKLNAVSGSSTVLFDYDTEIEGEKDETKPKETSWVEVVKARPKGPTVTGRKMMTLKTKSKN